MTIYGPAKFLDKRRSALVNRRKWVGMHSELNLHLLYRHLDIYLTRVYPCKN